MHEVKAPRLPKWPFLAGDGLLLASAYFVYARGQHPMAAAELALATGCVALGALFALLPYILEFRLTAKLVESTSLTTAVSQLQKLESIAGQISGATGRWQIVQEEAEKTAGAAKVIADRMTAEVKAFSEFMQRANDAERSHLRLEVEKLRRVESEWLQVLVRVLDHVHALHAGAVRSGQRSLIEQLTLFQNSCRDAARRVGLAPFSAAASEPFDRQRHQVADNSEEIPENAVVADTIASGYTFQGRMLRPALVRLNEQVKSGSASRPTPGSANQPELLSQGDGHSISGGQEPKTAL